MAAALAPTREIERREEDRDACEDAHDVVHFQQAWTRFQHFYARRKVFFHRADQQESRTTQRFFILSSDNDPWMVFGLTSRLEYRRRVYETCGLHFTRLHAACASGDKKCVQHLLGRTEERGESSDGGTLARDSSGCIPLYHAVVREHKGIIRLLLKQPNARLQLHERDDRGAPPVQYILEKMYRLALKDSADATVAARATRLLASTKRLQRLWKLADRMLLSMDRRLVEQLRWLDLATRGDSWDTVRVGDVRRLQTIHKLYEDDEAELAHLGYTLLHEACSSARQDLKVVHYLLSQLQVNRTLKTQSGATPLHCAATRGWLEACVLLLEEDGGMDDQAIDPEELLLATDNRGRTPLHACLFFIGRGGHGSRNDAIMTARYLAQRCPQSLHMIDCDGLTPLHYAVSSAHLGLVEVLIAMGASVFHDVQSIPRRREINTKAPWAPCGIRFQRAGRQPLGNVNESDDPMSGVPASTQTVAPSMACTRMHRVKAGQVEHPGEAVPMETLWFLLKRRPNAKRNGQCGPTKMSGTRHATRLKSAGRNATDGSSDGLDNGRFGCRRFGAVCASCQSAPGDSNDSSPYEEHAVALSVLVLAIRCCRLSMASCKALDERIAIVKSLLLAGCAIDDAAIHEALLPGQNPRLVQLVVTYAGLPLTRDRILAHFFPLFDDHLRTTELRQSMLSSLFDIQPELLDSSLLPLLFRWGYFELVGRIFSSGNPEELVRKMDETPQLDHAARKPRRPPEITASHLHQIRRWRTTCADGSAAFTALGYKCVNEVLNSSKIRTVQQRRDTDEAIAAVVREFSANDENWISSGSEMVVDWVLKAIHLGLVQTTNALWTTIVSTPALAMKLMGRLNWPLRLPWLDEDFVDVFARELLQAAMRTLDLETVETECLMTCLTVTCMYKISLSTIESLFERIKPLQDPANGELFVSRRFGGHTLAQWVVRNGRVEVAELLLSNVETNSELAERLWCALTLATIATPVTSTERWQALLFPRPGAHCEIEKRRQWLSSNLVRNRPCSPLLTAAVDWLCESPTDDGRVDFEWLENAGLVHQIARWNGLHVMQQLMSCCEVDWSRVVTQHDDADLSTPIELCELLGHPELARVMRRLASKEYSSPRSGDEDEPWPPSRRRHFGLLHTFLSLPPTEPSTTLASVCRFKGNPSAPFNGDWAAAVALNNIRLLDVLHLHEVPVTTLQVGGEASDGDALASLLETAITHGSLEAMQWLLSEQLTINIPKPRTRELVFQAARHTSRIHATMTLLLLQRLDVDPGRLSGDGDEATLLHLAARFTDTDVASSILKLLLAIEGSDVNAHDGVGATPVAYALGSGNLGNACFLLSHSTHVCLEAEFEGQTAFYYTLQLLPSFPSRWIVQTLLVSKCHATGLHCTTTDCACKGFERASVDEGSSCSFCSHAFESHVRVPFPPWFRDQYDSYLDPKEILANANDANDGEGEEREKEDDEEEEEDDEIASRCRLRALLEKPLVDETTLEHNRGRLNVRDLERITELRFSELISAHALVLPDSSRLSLEDPDDRDKLPACTTHNKAEPTNAGGARDSEANLVPLSATEIATDSVDDASSTQCLRSRERSLEPPPVRSQVVACSAPITLALLPWFLRGDVVMVVRTNAGCGRTHVDIHTTASGQMCTVITQWLRLTAARLLGWPQSDRAPATHVAVAFSHWHDVTRTATSTCVSFRGRNGKREACSSVVLDSQPVPRPEVGAEEPTLFFSSPSASSLPLAGVSATFPLVIGSTANTTNKSLSILQLFVHHWRYARVYQCFRLWKRRCESLNAQVEFHAIETLADTWAAEARRPRLLSLMARQHGLEETIKNVF